MAKPLAHRTIIVTRPREQAHVLGNALEQAGARVLYCAAIRITDPLDPVPFRAAIRRLHEFEWVVLTSVNGVQRFFDEAAVAAVPPDTLAKLRYAAVGPATAAAIEAQGLAVEVVPAEYTGAAIPAAMSTLLKPGARVLIARAANANPELPTGLRAAGADVVDVESYRSVPDLAAIEEVREALDRNSVDLIAFTSPSAVTYFTQAVDRPLSNVPVAVIGPITATRARDLGLRVEVEAAEHSVPGLVAAIVSFFNDT